jgi:hypothetical protein
MAFGKPDILDPKFELRPIQAAIRAARQRIEVIETAVTVLQANVAPGTATSIVALQAQLAALANLVSTLTAEVEGATAFDQVSAQLSMEGKMRTLAHAAVRDLDPPNSARAVLMSRMFNRR